MKSAKAIVLASLLASVGVAQAGSVGAGPAVSGSTAVGAIINPAPSATLDTPPRDPAGEVVLPGTTGTVQLDSAQIQPAADFMRSAEGVNIAGNLLELGTVLEDGGAATIILNTETGELTVKRSED
jgi:hypothetical protein